MKKARACYWNDEKGEKNYSVEYWRYFAVYFCWTSTIGLGFFSQRFLRNHMEVSVPNIVWRSVGSSGYHVVEGLVGWIWKDLDSAALLLL